MTAPGTAVARAESTAPALPPAALALVEERKVRNRMAAAIRGATWARDFDRDTQLAVAEYCYRNGIDPATEIEVLGGRLYKNAAYYERQGAELIGAGLVRAVDPSHVEHDPRLDEAYAEAVAFAADADKAGDTVEAIYWRTQANAARREIHRRRVARTDWNAPEKAAAVVVTRIALTNGVEVAGCNWCGNGIRKGDPVGDAEPSKTAETRSARRAWRKLAGMAQSDPALAAHPAVARLVANERTDDDDSVAVQEVITASRQKLKAQQAEHFPALAAGRGNDGYRPMVVAAYDDEHAPPAGRQDVAYDLDDDADASTPTDGDGGTSAGLTPDQSPAEPVRGGADASSGASTGAAIGGRTLAGGRVSDALDLDDARAVRRGRSAIAEP